MPLFRVPVTVSTIHYLDIDATDEATACAKARRLPPEEVRRAMPAGTTSMVGVPTKLEVVEP
jgi:hypothetical protein